MTNNNGNTTGAPKKTLGLGSGKLGIAVPQGVAAAPKIQAAARSNSPVIVITKGRGGVKKAAQSSSFDHQLSKEEQDKRLKLLKMAEAQKSTTAEEAYVIDEVVDTIVVEDVIIEEIAEVLVDEAPLSREESEVERKARLERSTYIKGLSLSRGKVRNLNQVTTAKTAEVEEAEVPEAPQVGREVIKKVVPEVQPKKGSIHSSKKKQAGDFSEEPAPISAVKKPGVAGDSKRLHRQSNKGSISHFAIIDSENEDNDDASYRRKSTSSIRKAKNKKNRYVAPQQEKVFREVLIPDFISVQELSNRMTEKAVDLIRALMKMGMMVTVNQSIDADTAELLVMEFGHKPKRITDAEFEKTLLNVAIDTPDLLQPRAPVVTIMGHVDHGKTSLLDALRLTDVVAKEAGGITQHIGAYNVTLPSGQGITFLDTPGHEAFTAMRMRGAKVTDIVVLVVAADDGIKEQTIEAIHHAKAAGVTIIVAVNKIDKPDSNPERVQTELLAHDLVPESMGGDIMIVNVSARAKIGLDKLEEAILLQAEILDLKANPNASASGAVIEASMDKARGAVATLLVQRGTLKVGDIAVVGSCYGKVKALLDDKGYHTQKSGPAMPVEMLGLNQAPVAGDTFTVVENESIAKELVAFRIQKDKERKIVSARKDSLEMLFTKARQDGSHKELAIIIKGDVNGSVEAIASSLLKITHEEVTIKILHSGVGGITESDVSLAAASRALIIGFNVRANNQAKEAAKLFDVDIKYYSIIYNLVDDVKAVVSGLLSPTVTEKLLGYADIRQVFDLTKFGKVAGCFVTEGLIQRHAHARLLRDDVVIHEGKLKALRRFKDDVKEVKHGFECGISFERYEDLKVGDKIEAFSLSEEMRRL